MKSSQSKSRSLVLNLGFALALLAPVSQSLASEPSWNGSYSLSTAGENEGTLEISASADDSFTFHVIAISKHGNICDVEGETAYYQKRGFVFMGEESCNLGFKRESDGAIRLVDADDECAKTYCGHGAYLDGSVFRLER